MADREKVIIGVDICLSRFHCGKDCPYYNAENRSGCMELLRKDALELLKEQEAMKPIYNEQKYGDHLPHCGNCEKVLPNNGVYGKVNFCHYCGQAVKWDE